MVFVDFIRAALNILCAPYISMVFFVVTLGVSGVFFGVIRGLREVLMSLSDVRFFSSSM